MLLKQIIKNLAFSRCVCVCVCVCVCFRSISEVRSSLSNNVPLLYASHDHASKDIHTRNFGFLSQVNLLTQKPSLVVGVIS